MNFRIFMNILLAGSLVACGPSKVNADSGSPVSKTVTVNGESPEVYFKRFTYKISGKCYIEGGVYFTSYPHSMIS